jgi:hypothetical protein
MELIVIDKAMIPEARYPNQTRKGKWLRVKSLELFLAMHE